MLSSYSGNFGPGRPQVYGRALTRDVTSASGAHSSWAACGAAVLLALASLYTRAQPDQPAVANSRAIHILRGAVLDPSGAVVPGATVTLLPATAGTTEKSAPAASAQTDAVGNYTLPVPLGAYYVVDVQAPGFAEFRSEPVSLGRRPEQHRLDVYLKLGVQIQDLDILADPAPVAGSPGTVLTPRDISTLPQDSAALLDQLQSLAGSPQAELYVDGFTGVKLPPRAQIREIRINQNPYSAQNDINPMSGTIQVLTRPTTDRLHGDFYLYGDDSAFDASNPFLPGQPGYYALSSGANLSGAIRPGASYLLSFDQDQNAANALVTPEAAAAANQTAPLALATPLSTVNVSPRLDLQPGAHSTSSLLYSLVRTHQSNGGVGQLALASEAYDNVNDVQMVRAANSQILGEHAIDDTRVQFLHQRTTQVPVSSAPTLLVEGGFLGGGSPLGSFSDHQDRFELQNYVALTAAQHFLNFGGRLRTLRDANRSTANFNGEYIFASLADYTAAVQALSACAQACTVAGASQFNITSGSPDADAAVIDLGIFLQDEWKLRPDLTISGGLRFESESFVPDHADWAPRAGFSWSFGRHGLGTAPHYVLHGGSGLFYQRFPIASALTTQRLNGIVQQQAIASEPGFYPGVPSPQSLPLAVPTLYRVSSRYHSPYYLGTTLALDRQISRFGVLSVSWLYNRGVHTQLIEDVNAPLPGTYNPAVPASGIRPDGSQGNIDEFASDGVYRSNRLSTTLNVRRGRLSLYSYYQLRFDSSDAQSNAFPSDSYHIAADLGRDDNDIRHTFTLRGTSALPAGFSLSGYIHTLSGAPFNIVVGEDLNGDSQFNDRPTFATDLTRPTVIVTRWGAFDTNPQPGQTIIPRNLGTGPALVLVTFGAGKSFGLGTARTPAPGSAASPRSTLDLWVESQNLLNHPNLGPPVGVLGSPFFGKSLNLVGANTLSPDRTIHMQLSLRF